MILSRSKPAIVTSANADGSGSTLGPKKHVPTLEEFLTKRDYTGALRCLTSFKTIIMVTLQKRHFYYNHCFLMKRIFLH